MVRSVKRVPDLRQQVFDRVRESIHAGALADDERITEMTVAKLYSVSRTPAREALALLSQAGLLAQDERGYRLPSFSRRDIDELFEVRRLIEPYAVRTICNDASDAELEALAAFARRELARSGETAKYAEANRRLRARIFRLVRNAKLNELVHSFEDRLAFIRVRTLRDPAIRRISSEGNGRLVEAISRRDADVAERTMHYLLDEAQAAIVALL